MTTRDRILVAVVGPSVALLAAFSVLVFLRVRADRLEALDAELAARAGAIAGTVEYDEGWELEPIPSHLTEGLAGFEVVSDEGETLVHEGILIDRAWTGTFDVESDGPAASASVTVSRDVAPIHADLWELLAELALLGTGLSIVAVLAGRWLSGNIVASEDYQRLEAAWRRQAAFAADASHELRTPIAVIKTNAEVALKPERTPEEVREALQGIVSASQRMGQLVEGLLLLARAGETLKAADADLVGIVRDSLASMSRKEGVELAIEAPPQAPVHGDARLLRVLVDNLVWNALRHTDAGSVTVRIEAEPMSWRLTVSDTGEGIPPEHQPRVFDRFYRVDGARSRSQGGSGLGLSLVRTIAEQHGGTARLSSTPGVGTTVTVILPR